MITKAKRIEKLLDTGASASTIAKAIKCNVSYVYQIAKARAVIDAADYEVMTDKTIVRNNSPVEIEVIHNKRKKAAVKKFKDQVVDKKKFLEFDASPQAIAWKGRNLWFGVDKDQTDYAIGLCMEAHTKNIDPKSKRYYTFIDQGMLNYVPPRDALDHWVNAVETKSVLDDAKDIIYGDREKTYGAPDKNLVAIAGYWSNHLLTRFGVFHEITGADVCVMMTLLKAARLGNNLTHRDSLVDAVGYLALLERIQKK